MESHKEVTHILILGLDNSGKTTLCKRLPFYEIYRNTLPKTEPTIGFTFSSCKYLSKHIIAHDVSSNLELRKQWINFVDSCSSLLYLIDISDEKRFEESVATLKFLVCNPKFNTMIPIIIVMNKIDLVESKIGLERMEIIKKLLKDNFNEITLAGFQFEVISCKNNEHLNNLLNKIFVNSYILEDDEKIDCYGLGVIKWMSSWIAPSS